MSFDLMAQMAEVPEAGDLEAILAYGCSPMARPRITLTSRAERLALSLVEMLENLLGFEVCMNGLKLYRCSAPTNCREPSQQH
jgi:hypothetical protein